jgi:DNA-directed RNA polymerase subunit RPC12/RpoP
MAQSFLEQSLCIREETSSGVQLAFPSQFNREIDIPTHPNVFVSYRFSGPLSTIYTTLVVRLAYSEAFEKKDLWKNAAEFLTPEGKIVGLVMKSVDEGVGEIKIFFETGVPDDTRVTFIKYVHEHLLKRATDVERERAYACLKCGKPVKDNEAIKLRQDTGKRDIVCVYCDSRIPLVDLIERKFNQDRFLKKVQRLDAEAKINLDNESRELILVGQATTTAAEAGQIYRGYTNSDHGIDGEIEFKDERGHASGKKIYLQLKSGDSYLYKRSRDEQEVFTVKKEQHLAYWQNQAYPVHLVIRNSDGLIRWMNVTEYLQQRQDKTSKQIIFEGEPFTAQSLLSLRNKLFGALVEA